MLNKRAGLQQSNSLNSVFIHTEQRVHTVHGRLLIQLMMMMCNRENTWRCNEKPGGVGRFTSTYILSSVLIEKKTKNIFSFQAFIYYLFLHKRLKRKGKYGTGGPLKGSKKDKLTILWHFFKRIEKQVGDKILTEMGRREGQLFIIHAVLKLQCQVTMNRNQSIWTGNGPWQEGSTDGG